MDKNNSVQKAVRYEQQTIDKQRVKKAFDCLEGLIGLLPDDLLVEYSPNTELYVKETLRKTLLLKKEELEL